MRLMKGRSSGSGSRIWVAPRQEEYVAESFSTRTTSACRVTAQNPGPAGQPSTSDSACQATG